MQPEVGLLGDSYEDEEIAAWWATGGELRGEGTTYVAVAAGRLASSGFHLEAGMYAALPGPATYYGSRDIRALMVQAKRYRGMRAAGGPVEETGRLRYIDGCTDTGLIGPIRRGDPCLNHLHFPPGIEQTLHTHPSIRIGLVIGGRGLCRAPTGNFPLEPGSCFIIPPGKVHGFTTQRERMDIIAFHPDSLLGPTDERHQMLEATERLGIQPGDAGGDPTMPVGG